MRHADLGVMVEQAGNTHKLENPWRRRCVKWSSEHLNLASGVPTYNQGRTKMRRPYLQPTTYYLKIGTTGTAAGMGTAIACLGT